MPLRRVAVALAVLALVFVAFAAVNAMIKTDVHGTNDYDCTDNATDPYCACMSTIGDERWCAASKDNDDGGDQTWGTECSDSDCAGVTNCPNGTQVSCSGEYRAFADEAGVRCQDTGSDPGTTRYCPD